MCYSARCRWENYMGDCRYPTHKLEPLGFMFVCEPTDEEYQSMLQAIKHQENYQLRSEKIKKLKNRLLDLS